MIFFPLQIARDFFWMNLSIDRIVYTNFIFLNSWHFASLRYFFLNLQLFIICFSSLKIFLTIFKLLTQNTVAVNISLMKYKNHNDSLFQCFWARRWKPCSGRTAATEMTMWPKILNSLTSEPRWACAWGPGSGTICRRAKKTSQVLWRFPGIGCSGSTIRTGTKPRYVLYFDFCSSFPSYVFNTVH